MSRACRVAAATCLGVVDRWGGWLALGHPGVDEAGPDHQHGGAAAPECFADAQGEAVEAALLAP